MKTIILAGGSGTRLWPLSRDGYPKQFIKLLGKKESLFQETFRRSLLLSSIEDIYVVTNEKYKFIVMFEVEELGYTYSEENILVEPEAKNTLPAIYAGVNNIIKKGHDIVVVFPSDHMVVKNEELVAIINESEALTVNSIITFGIQPDGPNTGYGYISPGENKLNGYVVNSFKEKPTPDKAIEYIHKGYYWNAGIFMFDSALFSGEVKKYSTEIYEAFETSDNIKDAFSKISTNVSIDYGIMEKSDKVAVVPVDIGWNDLGSFDAFYDVFQADENDNISEEQNIIIDSRNNLIQSHKGKIVAVMGINDLIIIDNKDALLVCKKEQAQNVKNVVEILKGRSDKSVEKSELDFTSWGHSKVLEEEKDAYKIKQITIDPGKRLSYHMQHYRSEHWIVVRGVAKVTVDSKEKILQSGESIFLREGQVHYFENLGKTSLEIIEVQIKE
ncbi:MAG: mannose-1-phosphate guanylyltransferase/mannose-6-phosphate isomerase [Firmicutes bacterium HGW-Firmicutes-3]|jgi:mannose-1-phosphate guanylyltransferase/mannose-6-phosphate isomerase|nr:MAG: mannose-1-phosphate guanylyltransferase/mannose-6-phosphate isomerase [Firmicutes bacterium HGW-Firmicutes-3]